LKSSVAQLAKSRVCPICYSDDLAPNCIALASCGHWACVECTRRLLVDGGRCAQCREPLRRRDLAVIEEQSAPGVAKARALLHLLENQVPEGESVIVACQWPSTAAVLAQQLQLAEVSAFFLQPKSQAAFAQLSAPPKAIVVATEDLPRNQLHRHCAHIVLLHPLVNEQDSAALAIATERRLFGLLCTPAQQRRKVFVTRLVVACSLEETLLEDYQLV
jgi:hypothetical protein